MSATLCRTDKTSNDETGNYIYHNIKSKQMDDD